MPAIEFSVNGIYRHDKSLEDYILISKDIRFKHDGIWYHGILYKKQYASKEEFFCRSKKEFMNSFTKIGMAE